MPNHWISEEKWCQSKSRTIDDATLCDLLAIIEYEAERTAALDELGIQDLASSNDALYLYVLDALGVPEENSIQNLEGEHERFSKKCLFSRRWFEELFYSEYLLNNETHHWTLNDVLSQIRKEVQENLNRHYK